MGALDMPILWQIHIMYDMIMGWRRSGCSLVQGGVMDGSNITIAQGVGCAFMLALFFFLLLLLSEAEP